MIVSPQTIAKLEGAVRTYGNLIFQEVEIVPARMWQTREHLRSVPGDEVHWVPSPEGTCWGEPWGSAWFRGEWLVTPECAGRRIYLRADTDGVETMLWVNGRPKGIFTHPRDGANIGNHHTLLLDADPKPGDRISVALEAYAGHPCVGSQPFDSADTQMRYPDRYPRVYRGMRVMNRNEAVMKFVFDLKAVLQLFRSLPETSFRRGHIARVLEKIFSVVILDPASVSGWQDGLASACGLMDEVLAKPAEASAPLAGLVGHSHLDTAWMWTLDETIRKAARTYSSVLSLMDQYPEFTFVQSSPFHAELMRRHYPSVWDGIKQRVREGRWEPNGGMWIECDCNLTGGEAMVRQFLKGIAFTREHFSYIPDTFWLPDTFGYNGAIPQIMRGCGLKYFLTTKLTWNEVNTFPYDTFWWQGVDGSRVLVHISMTSSVPRIRQR
jgi:alpha-mannosidase